MNTSIYDFDTQNAPFEALGSLMPYAPLAGLAMLSTPLYGWLEMWANTCALMSDAIVSAMTYPFELPVSPAMSLPVASWTEAQPHAPDHTRSRVRGRALEAC